MTRQEILNSNLPPEEKQRRLNMLDQISASTSGASLGGLLQSSMQNMGNNPLGITPAPVLPQTPTPLPSVNTLPLRNLPTLPNVNLRTAPRQGMQPPTIAQQIQPPKTAKRGIFNRIEKAYQDAAPMLAMAQEFNRMGAARPVGSPIPQGDPMGAYKRAKFGDQEKKLREERLAEKLGISLEEYIKLYGKTNNPLINEVKLTEYKRISEDADASRTALQNLNVMQNLLNDPEFKTGGLEEPLKEFRSFLNGLGLLNEENAEKLQKSETFAALANNSILPLVKQLGVNPTDRDLMFVQSAAPTLDKTKEANQLLIKILVSSQKRRIRLQEVYAQLSAANPAKDHPTLQMEAMQKVAKEFEKEIEENLNVAINLDKQSRLKQSVVSGIEKVN